MKYTPEIADTICERVAACEAVHQFAGTDGLPSESAIYDWLNKYPEFAEKYTRARERQADRMVAECREIADTDKEKMGAVERDRLRVMVRQWGAERMAPKKYGARLKQEVSGPNDGPIEIADASRKLLDMLDRRAPSGTVG
jgi:hypothetical protein